MSLLGDLRVLDLADGSGSLCGRILADLGADVIKIEPPDGETARREPPFARDVPEADRSLTWFGANLNKRGITLDVASATGRDLFMRLVRTADVVIETPGEQGRLDYDELAQANPRVILASLTAYGIDGPLAGGDFDNAVAAARWPVIGPRVAARRIERAWRRDTGADATLAARDLGFCPRTDLPAGLAAELAWIAEDSRHAAPRGV